MENLDLLTDTLHTLLCTNKHCGVVEELLKERKKDVCYFYVEKSLSNFKELPDHVFWKEQAQEFMQILQAHSPSNALASIYKILDFVEKFNQLSKPEQNLTMKLIQEILLDVQEPSS